MPRQGEEQLRLEAGAWPFRIEIGEERIVGLVEHHRRIEAGTELVGQR